MGMPPSKIRAPLILPLNSFRRFVRSILIFSRATCMPVMFPQRDHHWICRGFVRHDDPKRPEVQFAVYLRDHYPLALHVEVFANRDGKKALNRVLRLTGGTATMCLQQPTTSKSTSSFRDTAGVPRKR